MIFKNTVLKVLLNKFSYIALMLFIISVISFFAVNLAPNSFLSAGELNPNITQEQIEHLKTIYGLDKSLFERYVSWVSSFLVFDFGYSFTSGYPVTSEILERLPITLTINIISMVFVFFISIFAGIYSALNIGNKKDYFIKQFSLFSYAFPSFYLALLFIIVLSVEFGWFPISGLHSIDEEDMLLYYLDMVWHLFLPILVIVIGGVGSLTLYVRSLTMEILKSDYIFFAKTRGVTNKKLILKYIVPNLYPPIITILGLSLPGLIGGSVILESIFSINGMGLLFYQSALSRDYPIIMGILIIGALLTLLGNIIADLVLLKLNPYTKSKTD